MARRLTTQRITGGQRVSPAASPNPAVSPSGSRPGGDPSLSNIADALGDLSSVAGDASGERRERLFGSGAAQTSELLGRAGEAIRRAVGDATGDDARERSREAFVRFIEETGIPESSSPVWQLGFERALGNEMALRGRTALTGRIEEVAATRGSDDLPAGPVDMDKVVSDSLAMFDNSFAVQGGPGAQAYLERRRGVVDEFRNRVTERRAQLLAAEGREAVANELWAGDGEEFGGFAAIEHAMRQGSEDILQATKSDLTEQMTVLRRDRGMPAPVLRRLFGDAMVRRARDIGEGSPEMGVAFLQEIEEVLIDKKAVRTDFELSNRLNQLKVEITQDGEDRAFEEVKQEATRTRSVLNDVRGLAFARMPAASENGEALSAVRDEVAQEIIDRPETKIILGLDPSEEIPEEIQGLIRREAEDIRRTQITEKFGNPEVEADLTELFQSDLPRDVKMEALRAHAGQVSSDFMRAASADLDVAGRVNDVADRLPEFRQKMDRLDPSKIDGLGFLPLEQAEAIMESLASAQGSLREGLELSMSDTTLPEQQLTAGRAFARSDEARRIMDGARGEALRMVRDAVQAVSTVDQAIVAGDFNLARETLKVASIARPERTRLENQMQRALQTRAQVVVNRSEFTRTLGSGMDELDALLAESSLSPDRQSAERSAFMDTLTDVGLETLSQSLEPRAESRELTKALRAASEEFLGGLRPEPADGQESTRDRARKAPNAKRVADRLDVGVRSLEDNHLPLAQMGRPEFVPLEAWDAAVAVAAGELPEGALRARHLTAIVGATTAERSAVAGALLGSWKLPVQDLLDGEARLRLTGDDALTAIVEMVRGPQPITSRGGLFSSGRAIRDPVRSTLQLLGAGGRASLVEEAREMIRAAGGRLVMREGVPTITLSVPLDTESLQPQSLYLDLTKEQLDALEKDTDQMTKILGALGATEDPDVAFRSLIKHQRALLKALGE